MREAVAYCNAPSFLLVLGSPFGYNTIRALQYLRMHGGRDGALAQLYIWNASLSTYWIPTRKFA